MPVTDFGVQEIYDDSFILYLIENVGDDDSVLNGTFSFETGGGPFSIYEGTANYSIPLNESHTIIVRFNSDVAGVFNDIANFSGGGGEAIALSGEATVLTECSKVFENGDNKTSEDPFDNRIVEEFHTPELKVTPLSGAFGIQEIYDEAEIVYLIENIGELGSVLDGTLTFDTGAEFTISSGSPNYSLGTGDTHSITVRFTSPVIGIFNDNANFSGGVDEVGCVPVPLLPIVIPLSGETVVNTINKTLEDGDNKINEDPEDNTIPE